MLRSRSKSYIVVQYHNVRPNYRAIIFCSSGRLEVHIVGLPANRKGHPVEMAEPKPRLQQNIDIYIYTYIAGIFCRYWKFPTLKNKNTSVPKRHPCSSPGGNIEIGLDRGLQRNHRHKKATTATTTNICYTTVVPAISVEACGQTDAKAAKQGNPTETGGMACTRLRSHKVRVAGSTVGSDICSLFAICVNARLNNDHPLKIKHDSLTLWLSDYNRGPIEPCLGRQAFSWIRSYVLVGLMSVLTWSQQCFFFFVWYTQGWRV